MSLELLWEHADLAPGRLTAELRGLYGGDLGFDGPTVYANFVATLDGVVSIPDVDRSNALVADESADDRFLMGVLRALADVVLIGTGTLLASPKGRWRPEGVHPAGRDAFAALRAHLGKAERPAVAIVTSGASLDVTHPAVTEGALVLTTAAGASRLEGSVPELVAVSEGDRVDLRAAIDLLRRRGHEHVLAEAGPTTFGRLVADGLVDELFLTTSPVLAGRREPRRRLSLVEGVELLPDVRVALTLVSLRRSAGTSHLFARYRL